MAYDGTKRPEGPVEIRVLPEGESGIVVGRLSEATVESLASFWAQPNHLRLTQRGNDNEYAFLASRLGVTTAFVRKSQRDPRVLAAVRKRVNEAITYLMPDVVYAMATLAIEKRDKQAAALLAKMSDFIKERPEIQNTIINQVGVHTAKDGGLKEDLANFQWLRDLQRSGAFDKIPAQITDGSDESPATGT